MRLYRALLHLYPASFRAEYGEEMAGIFRMRLRERSSPAGRAVLWMAVVAEVAGAALAVHVDILRQDLRYAVRTFGRARSFALTAILIVALGIGANTAAFSITDFVLLRPLPFPHADRLVTIWQRTQGYSHMELSPANYHDWRAGAQSFERMGAYTTMSATLSGSGEPERVDLAQFTSDVFPTLGIPAALGRYFSGGEDFTFQPDSIHGGEPLAVLSDGLWRSAFGADPGVLGRKIRLEGRPFTVIGVMPAGFGFPTRGTQLWIPYGVSAEDYQDRNNNYLSGLGRLKPGATLASARSEMALAAARSEQAYPKDNKDIGALVDTLHDELSDPARTMVLALSGAALCVLLIVCANLANLLLGRALGRRLELAVRTAMGAGRERLVRQLATESLLLAAVGGALGVFMAWLLVPLLWRLVPADFPTTASPGIDLRVLAFAGALTIATALLFGLAPVFPLMRTRATGVSALRDGTRTTGRKERLRGALVVAEVVASVVLLVVTGLLMRTLLNVQGRDPGFRPDGVLTLQTDLSASTYGDTARRTAFYTRVLDRVRALPGVGAAAYISGLPMVWGGGIWPVGLTGVELERRRDNTASLRFATPGFFGALAIPILRGRDVSDDDTLQTQMVAVVSESFVERYWPGEDAIGRRFNFGMADRTIVGVVGNIRMRGLERESEPQVYLPYRQQPDQALWGYVPKNLVVSAGTPPAQLVPAVRAILHDIDPQQPITKVRTLSDIVRLGTASRAVQVRALAAFAIVAFLLAAIGLHGVLAFAVSQRTAEIGVRIALGAQRRDILGMVMRRGVLLVAAGALVGLPIAYAAGRWLQSLLVGVTPADAPTFAATLALTALMAAAGTLLPTLRALRIDPVMAIRTE